MSRVSGRGTDGETGSVAFGLSHVPSNSHGKTHIHTYMQQRVHPHTHPHLPPPSLQPPLQLSINFPFCLVAADIPNTAISDLASDLAPWKPSAPPPAYGVPYPHQSIGLTAWRCYCIQKGRVFRRCIGREGRTGQTGIFKKTGGDVVVGHVCVQPGPHLLYLYLYRVTTKTHLCPR